MSSISRRSYRAEMGFSQIELLRELPSAVEPYTIRMDDDKTFVISGEGRVAKISMSKERVRKIASLTLPVIDIVIDFDNFNEQQYDDFISQFKKSLHRGGG